VSQSFDPIEKWKAAVVSGDPVALKSFYSYSPPAVINTSSGKVDTDGGVAFWIAIKARAVTVKAVEAVSPRPDLQAFTLLVKVRGATGKVTSVLKPNYELVDVDIGEENKNLDIAAQYEVPLNRGVPAVAVLDSSGKLIYSQKSGEWERARALGPDDLVQFLKKWKPQSR
jgi:hypothetical protein